MLHTFLRRCCLQNRVSFWFGTAASAKKATLKEQRQDITLAFYYRQLLRTTRVKQLNGMARFDMSHLNRMIKLTTNPQQASLLLQAFYNLKGNYTHLSQTITDNTLLKYLQVKGDPTPIVELFENHKFLGYFPHYKVTLSLLKAVEGDPEKLQAFIKAIKQNRLIKVDDEIVQALLQATQGSEDAGLLTEIVKLAEDRQGFVTNNPERFAGIVNERNLQFDQTTQELFEKAKNAIDVQKIREPKKVIEISRFLLAAGDASRSIVIVSKVLPADDQVSHLYFQSLLHRLAALSENPQELDKLIDEYTLLLSKKAQGEKTLAIHSQIQELINNRKNPQEQTPQQSEPEQPKNEEK